MSDWGGLKDEDAPRPVRKPATGRLVHVSFRAIIPSGARFDPDYAAERIQTVLGLRDVSDLSVLEQDLLP